MIIMEKENKCKIPYQKDTGWGAAMLLMTFGRRSEFPLWCVYTCYAIALAVMIYWTVYAYLHNDRKATTKYLLLSMAYVIIFALMIYFRDLR